ncbi:hypothetical protein H5410_045019 [Solanum commersonii]|uniref:Uncharacterized protein n=1 Tax=Solanum commersonii TaxID=4109 RepID=A0A9J5X8E7_SOLCO|nr:hypothetical protein H5410_045019 [Solanum commersonii]
MINCLLGGGQKCATHFIQYEIGHLHENRNKQRTVDDIEAQPLEATSEEDTLKARGYRRKLKEKYKAVKTSVKASHYQ